MKGITAYLNFDGNTGEAMRFYERCIGGELHLQTFKESNVPSAPGGEDRVMHARLVNGPAVLMASDTQPGTPFTIGNNVWLTLECDGTDEQDRMFSALTEGGTVAMELQDTFWGARFGMLTDRFGIGWMLNCQLEGSAAS